MSVIRLVVGLGNPGADYQSTRHNAGAWYLDALARQLGITLHDEKKYFGQMGSADHNGVRLYLLAPATFMNLSGQSTSVLANFFRITPGEMLVAHDELDIPPGSIRLKQGGGHGGHNGLRDIIAKHGNQQDFLRLRIGIGHPGDSSQVTPWVLGKPTASDRQRIDEAIELALQHTTDILAGNVQKVMNQLNGKKSDN
jgi:PTH1 family peptidyl-tRNA hydrolase